MDRFAVERSASLFGTRRGARQDRRIIREFNELTRRVTATGAAPGGYRSAVVRADRVLHPRAAQDERALARLRQLTERYAKTGNAPQNFVPTVLESFTAISKRDIPPKDPNVPAPLRDTITDEFFRLYYNCRRQTWLNTRFLGTGILKNPLDLWIYQELLHEVQPDVIIETGTKYGGSASYLARLCDLMGKGRVITVDIQLPPHTTEEMMPKHPRISYVRGSSTDPVTVDQVKQQIQPDDTVVVILDSDHERKHVYAELQAYADLVRPGSYVIVEDTCIDAGVITKFPSHYEGPLPAVMDFLADRKDFEIDKSREKFFFTKNPSGYLRRISE